MNTRYHRLSCGLLAAVLTATSTSLAVPFDGHTLSGHVVFGGLDPYPGTSVSFVVDSTPGAVEVPAYGAAATLSFDVFDVDPTHASIVFRSLRTEPFSYGSSPNLVVFTDILGAIPDILGVSLGAFNWPGADAASRIAFTSDSFSFDFGDMRIVEGDYFQLDITTAAAAASVPETGSTAGLFSLGLAGLTVLAKKRVSLT